MELILHEVARHETLYVMIFIIVVVVALGLALIFFGQRDIRDVRDVRSWVSRMYCGDMHKYSLYGTYITMPEFRNGQWHINISCSVHHTSTDIVISNRQQRSIYKKKFHIWVP